jgi:hypothetical protein
MAGPPSSSSKLSTFGCFFLAIALEKPAKSVHRMLFSPTAPAVRSLNKLVVLNLDLRKKNKKESL